MCNELLKIKNLVMLKVVMGGTEIFREKVPRYSVYRGYHIHVALLLKNRHSHAASGSERGGVSMVP
mgnify:CR=1 FL=1